LPVRFAIDRAGLSAPMAQPTQALSTSPSRILPGMVVMAAADEAELVHMVATAAAYDEVLSLCGIRAAKASESTCDFGKSPGIGRPDYPRRQ